MSNSEGNRVLIVDQHPILRFAFREFLQRDLDLEFVGTVASESEARELIEVHRPELVLYGLEPARRGGLPFIAEIHAEYLGTSFLVYSVSNDPEFAELALRAGARGFLVKSETLAVFAEAVRNVLRGEMYISPSVAQRLVERSVNGVHQRDDQTVEGLSRREKQVFEMIGRGLTTRAIANRLGVNIKTVETFRSKIKRKLELNNGAELTCSAVEWVIKSDELAIS